MNYNGQQIRSTAIQSIKKVGNDYISETSTNIPGQASGVGTVWFYASGALAGVSQSNGSTFTVSGTWYSSGNSFYWSGRQQGVNIDFTQEASFTLIDTNRYTSVTSASYGLSGVGEATRILPPSITSDLTTVSVAKGKLIQRFTITTNFGAKTFAAKGLPKGLKLNTKNGVISGKPTKAGTYTVTLTARKMKGKKVEKQATATKVFVVY